MTLSPGTRLGPYEILSLLGAGGMGEVYRARDDRLDRVVAIKILPASTASDPAALARFEHEAKAVASLAHPNILSMFDFGTHNGVPYVVTALLDGETLRARLAAGRLPTKEAVGYALQIARGLSAAHERGIVHRDLKPENIFVSASGHVTILDFGLAKRIGPNLTDSGTSAPTAAALTAPGTIMGTAAYMSPEQIRGLAVDQRTDLFSFGSILYEVLSGERAFQRETTGDTLAAILREEPADLSASVSGQITPATLERVVRHCLEKDPRNRFQSASDVAFALLEASSNSNVDDPPPHRTRPWRQAMLVFLGLAVFAAAAVFFRTRFRAGPSLAVPVKRIAVLPFENLGSPDDEYFADGIADAVRGKLTSLKGIEVIGRGSSVSYRKTTKSQRVIAEELDAPYLLSATVRWQKVGGTSRVQVTPELVEVRDSGAPASKWQQSFDTALTDVFEVQSEIASKVAQSLGIALGAADEARLDERPTRNLAAYEAFLKGEHLVDATQRRKLAFYEQAVALDPDFPLAWARVADLSAFLYWFGAPAPELAERARQAAERAVTLAPDRPDGYLARAAYQEFVAVDLGRAVQQYRRAFALGPMNADLLSARARIETRLGEWDTATAHVRQAERLDPRSVALKIHVGVVLLSRKFIREARDECTQGLALEPTSIALVELLAETFLMEGDLAGARGVVSSASKDIAQTELVATLANVDDLVWILDEPQTRLLLRLTPDAFGGHRATWAVCLAQACALKGYGDQARLYAEEARKALEADIALQPQDPQRHAFLGLALAYLGRKKDAIQEAERAVAIQPLAKNAFLGPYYQHQLVRIYTLVGEPRKALDQLGPLLRVPYSLTPGWLRIDPNFDPLRTDARFQKLAGMK